MNSAKGKVGFQPIPLIERLERYTKSEGDCIVWTGSRSNGYGRIEINKVARPAHRVVYEFFFGPVSPELHIDHLCRNPPCVNPVHLEPVTPRENAMRGFGPSALNNAKTTCKFGHPLSGENLRMVSTQRVCRICARAADQRYKQRRRSF